jgi:hypothetical protein
MANPTGKGGFKDRKHQINKKGRPEGSKNKTYLDASLWLSLAFEEVLSEEDPKERRAIITWATQLIMQKVPVLPATPGDSVDNALAAQNLLKAMEHNAHNPDPIPAANRD